MGWHDLTEIKADLNLDNNRLTEWDIVQTPLCLPDGTQTTFKILTGDDDGEVIGKPYAHTYTPITNKQFLDMVREAISGVKGAVVESVGSVNNRGRVFVSISIKEMANFKVGSREFLDYLNFGNGHDQTCAVWANESNTCTVCDNTFTLNFEGTQKVKVKVNHTKDVAERIVNISEIIDAYCGTQAKFKAEFARLLNEPLKKDKAKNLFAGWLCRSTNSQGNDLGPRTVLKVDRLMELFETGAGNTGDNRADAFSAVTDFYTHESTRNEGANVSRQLFSSDFGIGAKAKINFWNVVRNDNSMNAYISSGRKAYDLLSV